MVDEVGTNLDCTKEEKVK